jgi:hypothetical protein
VSVQRRYTTSSPVDLARSGPEVVYDLSDDYALADSDGNISRPVPSSSHSRVGDEPGQRNHDQTSRSNAVDQRRRERRGHGRVS